MSDSTRVGGIAGFAAALVAVFWSFFGVRRESDHARDAVRLRPIHVVVAALLATALVVFTLLAIVHAVVK